MKPRDAWALLLLSALWGIEKRESGTSRVLATLSGHRDHQLSNSIYAHCHRRIASDCRARCHFECHHAVVRGPGRSALAQRTHYHEQGDRAAAGSARGGRPRWMESFPVHSCDCPLSRSIPRGGGLLWRGWRLHESEGAGGQSLGRGDVFAGGSELVSASTYARHAAQASAYASCTACCCRSGSLL